MFAASISSLEEFYRLMASSRELRVAALAKIEAGQGELSAELVQLQQLRDQLQSLPAPVGSHRYQKELSLEAGGARMIPLDLRYELGELEKDLFYLEHRSEAELERYLEELHGADFAEEVAAVQNYTARSFAALISDRDGTVNNYCARYRSSVQSLYNALFLRCFIGQRVQELALILTAAPLRNPGIVDLSLLPPGKDRLLYAASKGREFLDWEGQLQRYPIENDTKEAVLAEFNDALQQLLAEASYQKFALIGSGLQFKFGQTTVARQDFSHSIPTGESQAFREQVQRLLQQIDPAQEHLYLEDTGYDLEIILTIAASSGAVKDFDKGDGVGYVLQALPLDLAGKEVLVCGDTASDLPMLRAVQQITERVQAIFVTKDAALADQVQAICPEALIVSRPDALVLGLARATNPSKLSTSTN